MIRRYVLVKAEPTDAAENAKIALSVCWVVGFAWFIRTLLVKLFLNRVGASGGRGLMPLARFW